MTALLVMLGAALGSVLRYETARRLDGRWHHGTGAVNVVASGLVGAFAALSLDGSTWALLAVGLCGGLSTYSGFAVQVHDLGWRRGGAYAVTTVGLSLAACAAAFALVG